MTFTGFGEGLFDFYAGLRADNSKAYWTDHRETYEREVREPMDALVATLSAEFGPGKMFRPHRDVRFSKDKSPYKTSVAASVGEHYLHLDTDGLLVAGGYYQMARDQVDRYRRSVADDVAGPALERVTADLVSHGWEIGGDRLKTTPRGWSADHPRIDLLRCRSMHAWQRWEPAEWMHTPECARRIADAWLQVRPLAEWLETHVGASAEPPPARR